MAEEIQNFDLLFERSKSGYRVLVDSSGSEADANFRLPFSQQKLENFLSYVLSPAQSTRSWKKKGLQMVKDFGGGLFKAVFKGQVLLRFCSSLDEAVRHEKKLRICLRFVKETSPLLVQPWEYLYYPDRNLFLGFTNTFLVRYLRQPQPPKPLSIVKPPLRVLVMISCPIDYPQLNVEEEWQKVREAFSSLESKNLVVLERLDRATSSALQHSLQKKDYHIFHFIGHGDYNEQANEGMLIFENEERRGDPISSQYIAKLLEGQRLVILNACKGARTSYRYPFAGIAQSLVQEGSPAVIAMQFEITDEAAITFTRAFYGALANGLTVDAAMAEARKAIFLVKSAEWGIPVLFMRSPDGRIFDFKGIEKPGEVTPTQLREILTRHFSVGDLRTLCFDLRSVIPELDYDSLPAVGKADKARELVLYFEQRGHFDELVRVCSELRPKAPW